MPPFRKHLGNKSKVPRSKVFLSSRLAEAGEASEVSDPQQLVEEPDEDVDISSEEDEIPAAVVNPYTALLQSLNSQEINNEQRRKRRKLDQPQLISKDDATSAAAFDQEATNMETEDDNENNQDDGETLDSSDDENEDAFRSHVDVDDQSLTTCINNMKTTATAPVKAKFCNGWKAFVSGPSDCAARRASTRSQKKFSLSTLGVKDQLQKRASRHLSDDLPEVITSLASSIFGMQDMLFCGRTSNNSRILQTMTCLHALNYVLKTRNRVLKNTARLAKAESDDLPDVRDQGYTRPKVLILLPTKQACYWMADTIMSLYEPEQQENRKKFNDFFSRNEDDASEQKPEDYHQLFDGNNDDLFRLGIKFTRKTVKFFSGFYNSDVIFASPLGLRMAMTKKDSKQEDFDFLSSIELLIMDHADALLQQNWEHVQHVFAHLNLPPKNDHECDFSRVRNWYLEGYAKYIRQTIILSSFLTPEVNQLYQQYMFNFQGSLKVTPEAFQGAIVGLEFSTKQSFARFDAMTPQKESEARFKAFTTTIVPNIVKLVKSGVQGPHGILIFVPSYFDFPRVRNLLSFSGTAQDISFGTISEYTSSSDVARARSHFTSGRHSVLIYTGRAHHFHRYKIKGVKKVFMYSLPDNPQFYSEVAGGYLIRSVTEGLIAPVDATVRSLFCKYDILKLERIVGSKRVAAMLREQGEDVFDFS